MSQESKEAGEPSGCLACAIVALVGFVILLELSIPIGIVAALLIWALRGH